MLAASTFAAHASPLSPASFERTAFACAPGLDISTLRAIAAVESHFNPLAVRDNSTHEAWAPTSLGAATKIAKDRLKSRHSVDIGLMQINNENLVPLGMSVDDAFDPCHSLNAAMRILSAAFAAGSSEMERQAAILITLSRYNTGRPLAGITSGYVNRVITAQRDSLAGNFPKQGRPQALPHWDVWGDSAAEAASWILTTANKSEIERAGAQSDARTEGRVPASSSEKGEPYEVSAYRESEKLQQ